MIACYIIFSKKLNRFYIGVTQEDLNLRIVKHNEGTYGNHRFTAKATDWESFLYIETTSIKHALAIEKHIKAMKSSLYVRNLAKYPEMIEDLKAKYV
ncbi:MAG: GIY-YIG nuclease family protein [Bacteroidota bacterium]|nr:GIY-YIG nuclease family protein [Bacteroidota bacterium]